MIRTIAWRELRNLFVTPTGWAVLAVVQAVQGLIFYRLTQAYQAAPVTTGLNAGVTYNVAALFLGSTGYVALLTVPLLTMHLISGERRRRSLPLLLSAPVSGARIILGKYLGVTAFLLLLLLQLTLMPLFLATGAHLDFGLLASAWLGTALLLAAYAALGLYMSTLADRPALAAAGAIAALLLFWIVEMLAATGIDPLDRLLDYLSIFRHYEPLLRGVVDSRDLGYFLLSIALFLGLATLRLDAQRRRP